MTIPSHFGVRLMARIKSAENAKDPATGRPLLDGVGCRGLKQYRARKLVNGQRIIRTFDTARLARAWLEETLVRDGIVLRTLIERYRDECMVHRNHIRKPSGRRLICEADHRAGHPIRRSRVPALARC